MGHSHIQRLLGLSKVIYAGHDDNARLRVCLFLPDVADQRKPVHDRHAQVGQDDIRAFAQIHFIGFFAVGCLIYPVNAGPVPVQHVAHTVKGKQLVFHDQSRIHIIHRHSSISSLEL